MVQKAPHAYGWDEGCVEASLAHLHFDRIQREKTSWLAEEVGAGGLQICIRPGWGGLRISTPHCCKAKSGVELWWSKNGQRSGAEVNGIHINVVDWKESTLRSKCAAWWSRATEHCQARKL
jgi:hypothetical protein